MSEDTRGPRRVHRYPLRFGIELLALSLLLVGAGVAAGSGAPKPAQLKVTAPASVSTGSNFKVTASGYSGKFNSLAFFALKGGACKSTYTAQTGPHTTSGVTPNHNFKKSASYHASSTGTYRVCVYLYRRLKPGGSQLHKSTTYKVAGGSGGGTATSCTGSTSNGAQLDFPRFRRHWGLVVVVVV
jgi:hypothetical protein